MEGLFKFKGGLYQTSSDGTCFGTLFRRLALGGFERWGLLDSQAGIDELKARDKDFNNFVIGKHKRMPIPTSEVEISKIDDVPQLTQNPNY